MAIDLSILEQPMHQTVTLSGILAGFELQLRHRGVRERERFHDKLLRDGIMKKTQHGEDINAGRMSDFVAAFAEAVVVGWNVPERFRAADSKDTNPPYDAKELAKILDVSPDSVTQLFKAAVEETGFFSPNGNGSQG